ncbi:MAG: thiamine-phosphate kinase [Phycisphaerales bacterium]|nr:thiamine-phosphate kinase [Phycisphaerales bacterium]
MQEADVMALIGRHVTTRDPRVRLGPGDDLAVLDASGGLLAGVDQVIDGVHVLADRVSWDRIGRKAVSRSLSDIAAMGGRPLATLAAVVLPAGAREGDVERLCRGLQEAAERWGAPLVGGDVAFQRSGDAPLTISVTVLGLSDEPVRRSGGRPGDDLYVTGVLGGAVLPDGGGHHLDFSPRLPEAAALTATIGRDLHAMIDISDGLCRDAGRLAEASGCRAVLRSADIPVRVGVPREAAFADGEDYELLFAVAGGVVVPDQIGPAACAVTRIGTLGSEAEPRVAIMHPDGTCEDGSDLGWMHGS